MLKTKITAWLTLSAVAGVFPIKLVYTSSGPLWCFLPFPHWLRGWVRQEDTPTHCGTTIILLLGSSEWLWLSHVTPTLFEPICAVGEELHQLTHCAFRLWLPSSYAQLLPGEFEEFWGRFYEHSFFYLVTPWMKETLEFISPVLFLHKRCFSLHRSSIEWGNLGSGVRSC